MGTIPLTFSLSFYYFAPKAVPFVQYYKAAARDSWKGWGGEVVLERREKNSLFLGMNAYMSGAHACAVHVWTDPKEIARALKLN